MLTDFNGIQITYDEIGNPTAIDEVALSWDGRQLKQVVDGGNTYSYAYNIDGQRVSKTVTETDGTVTTTEYFYNGSILAGQKTGEDTLVFMYDDKGTAFGFTYNGTEYYYLKNAQGDVDAVVDSNRQIVAKYAYDAWGKVISVTDADGVEITDNTHIGHINPIRYRGYYYDRESNFYYLNSRYYAPDICRFLNADGIVQTGQGMLDKNMFAYCLNNPIMYMDPQGTSLVGAILVTAAIGLGLLLLTGCSVQEAGDKLTDAVELYDKWDSYEEDITYDIAVTAANVIDENCGKDVTYNRQYRNEKVKLNPRSKKRRYGYGKMIEGLKAYGGVIGVDLDISGKSWAELTDRQKEVIVSNYIIWDPDAYTKIGIAYGFYLTEDLAEETIKSIVPQI